MLYLNGSGVGAVKMSKLIEPIQNVVFKYEKVISLGNNTKTLNLYRMLYLNRLVLEYSINVNEN